MAFGIYQVEQLGQNNGLGVIPDWQFKPTPAPWGSGEYAPYTFYDTGSCPSAGISGPNLGGKLKLLGRSSLGGAGLTAAMFGQYDNRCAHPFWSFLAWALATGGAATGAYHGYKRNDGSVGWAIGWAAFGFFLPVLSIPISLAQGFGKPK